MDSDYSIYFFWLVSDDYFLPAVDIKESNVIVFEIIKFFTPTYFVRVSSINKIACPFPYTIVRSQEQ